MKNETLNAVLYLVGVLACVFVTLCLIISPKELNVANYDSGVVENTFNNYTTNEYPAVTNVGSAVSKVSPTYDPCHVWENKKYIELSNGTACFYGNGRMCGNCEGVFIEG